MNAGWCRDSDARKICEVGTSMPGISPLLAVVLALALPTSGIQNRRRGAIPRNHAPRIISFTVSESIFNLCPFFTPNLCNSGTVRLKVEATDPENDALRYKYSVSAGTVEEYGPEASWDLSRGPVGIQTTTVEVTDSRGRKSSSTITVKVVECSTCDPPRPYIRLNCPASITQGDTAEFTASVMPAEEQSPDLKYLWSHSHGEREAGQEGATLRIKAIGAPGQVISVTVTILGLDPATNRVYTCRSTIEKKSF